MINEELSFRFELSAAELHWLSGAFGFMYLPLAVDPISKLSLDARKIVIQRAQDSLQQRDLIHRVPGQGWQVDRLPATVVRWLGSATKLLSLDFYPHKGTSYHAHVFTATDMSMHVTMQDDKYCFLFLPDRWAMSDYLLNRFGASFHDHKAATPKYPLAEPVTILRSAWTDPSLAAKMLKVVRLKTGDEKSWLAWAEALEWIVALNRIELETEGSGNENQAVLCGTRQMCWGGYLNGRPDNPMILSSLNMEETQALIESLL